MYFSSLQRYRHFFIPQKSYLLSFLPSSIQLLMSSQSIASEPDQLRPRTKSGHVSAKARSAAHVKLYACAVKPESIDDDVETTKEYPETAEMRRTHISYKTGKPVTEYQYRVFDACKQVPTGYFTTYKAISDYLGSGPRAVGNALSKNPFAPLPVPCHRVLTSDCYIGGFDGDKKSKIFWKRAKLEKEGILFDDDGFVVTEMQNTRFFDGFN